MASPFVRTISSLVILSAAFGLFLTPPSCTADNILYSGDTLYTGQSLNYGSYVFTMQEDCNLVHYDNGYPLWASGTSGRGYNCILRMQSDGNLVIYSNNNPVWASNTGQGQGYFVLVVQRDRNVVIYGGAIWHTNTARSGVSSSVVVNVAAAANATGSDPVTAAAARDLNSRKITMVTKN